MPSNYPDNIDSLTNPNPAGTLGSENHSGMHTDANDAIEAIETELGVTPSGVNTTVAERLDTLVVGVDGTRNIFVSGTAPTDVEGVDGDLWFSETPTVLPNVKGFADARNNVALVRPTPFASVEWLSYTDQIPTNMINGDTIIFVDAP